MAKVGGQRDQRQSEAVGRRDKEGVRMMAVVVGENGRRG